MNKNGVELFYFCLLSFLEMQRRKVSKKKKNRRKQAKTGKSVIVPRHLLHHLLHLKITLNYYEYQYVICSVIDVIDKRNETII